MKDQIRPLHSLNNRNRPLDPKIIRLVLMSRWWDSHRGGNIPACVLLKRRLDHWAVIGVVSWQSVGAIEMERASAACRGFG